MRDSLSITRLLDQPIIDPSTDPHTWRQADHGVVLYPEHDWEGANQPLIESERGQSVGLVNQLRDPCIFIEDETTYLLYSVAGESGIAIAEVKGLAE
jgi:hypothetical protein